MRASAPPVLPLDNCFWPYGPQRLCLELRETADWRVHLLDPERGHALWVDPSLPAPGREGPLAGEAERVRELPPPGGAELELRGPRAPWPGARAASRCALLALLAAVRGEDPPAPSSPAEEASRRGEPVHVHAGVPPALDPARVAWLDAGLLLFRDRVGEPRAPSPEPGGGLFGPEPPEELLAELAGVGLDQPRSPREDALLSALRAGGLTAAWSLGAGFSLGLAPPAQREAVLGLLDDHGLDPCALQLAGVRGLELERGAG